MSWMKTDNDIELREEFQLSCLAAERDFSAWEVFQILLICDNVYREF